MDVGSSLYILATTSLMIAVFANLFSRSVACLFVLFNELFCRVKAFNCNETQFINFSFYGSFSGGISVRTLCLVLDSEDTLVFFFSQKIYSLMFYILSSILRDRL